MSDVIHEYTSLCITPHYSIPILDALLSTLLPTHALSTAWNHIVISTNMLVPDEKKVGQWWTRQSIRQTCSQSVDQSQDELDKCADKMKINIQRCTLVKAKKQLLHMTLWRKKSRWIDGQTDRVTDHITVAAPLSASRHVTWSRTTPTILFHSAT